MPAKKTRFFVRRLALDGVSGDLFFTAFVCGLLGAIYFAIYGKDLGTGARSAAEIFRA